MKQKLLIGSIMIQLSQGGGYIPPDYAFLDEAPTIAVYEDGHFIRRLDDSQTRIAVWKEGILGREELEKISEQIEGLGFWKWDEGKINKEILKNPITDQPTTVITVRKENRQKSVSLYGLMAHFNEYKLPGLKKPKELADLLESLKPDKLHQPESIELFMMALTCLSHMGEIASTPWPFKKIPVAPEASDCSKGYRVKVQGKEAGLLLETLSRRLVFSEGSKKFVVRYHP